MMPWKIFAVALLVTQVPFFVFLFVVSETGWLDHTGMVLDLLLLPGLFGFAWKKPLLFPLFWQVLLVVGLGWHIFLSDWNFQGEAVNMGLVSGSFGNLLFLSGIVLFLALVQILQFLVIYRYAFRSDGIWLAGKERG